MLSFSKTCLIISTCCIIALQAYTIRQRDEEEKQPIRSEETEDSSDYELGHLIDVEALDDSIGYNEDEQRTDEPDAEMLPEHFAGVKSPGVDHMEMTQLRQDDSTEKDDRSKRPLKNKHKTH